MSFDMDLRDRCITAVEHVILAACAAVSSTTIQTGVVRVLLSFSEPP